jgi:hypothetical protein
MSAAVVPRPQSKTYDKRGKGHQGQSSLHLARETFTKELNGPGDNEKIGENPLFSLDHRCNDD